MRATQRTAVGVEGGDQRVNARKRNQRVDGDSQLGLPAGGHALDASFDFTRSGQQDPAFGKQCPAGRRELRAVAPPIEQQQVEVLLHPAYGIGDGGGHVIELERRRREAAAAVDRIQHGQRIEREPHSWSRSFRIIE